jgi:hypothetical protein
VAVVLRLWQPILRKLSHFDFAVFRGNLLGQAKFALPHRAEALDRLAAREVKNGRGLDVQRIQVSSRQPHLVDDNGASVAINGASRPRSGVSK